MRRCLVWGAFCVVLFGTATASACIAEPITYTLRDAWPTPDAQAVHLNSPLVIRLEALPSGVNERTADGWTNHPLYNDTTGEVVPGVMSNLGPRAAGGVFSFVPGSPLEPQVVYRVDLGAPPPQAGLPDEPSQSQWRFMTGTADAPPLQFEGTLTVQYELGSDPVVDCSQPSLCGCPVTGEHAVTKARVTLPTAIDGYSAQGLWAELTIEEQDPAPPAPSELVTYDLTEPTSEVLRTMPEHEDGTAYVPCFNYSVQDARGDSISTRLCASAAFPLPSALMTEGQTTETGSSVPRTSMACSFDSAPSLGAPSGAAWPFVGAALLLFNRRRRSKSAP